MDITRVSISDSAALLELDNIINASQDLEFILGNVLLTSMGKLMISRACVLLRDSSGRFSLHSDKGIPGIEKDLTFEIDTPDRLFIDLDADGATTDMGDDFIAFCDNARLRYLVPMVLREEVVGIVAFGEPHNHAGLTGADTLFLESIAAMASTAVGNAMHIEQLRIANRRLDEKIQEQQTLYEVSREMNGAFEEKAIYRLLGYALMGQLRIVRYAVLLDTGAGFQAAINKLPLFTPNDEACTALIQTSAPRLLTDTQERTEADKWIHSAGAEVLIPMVSHNKVLGLLCLGERMGTSGYTDSEIEYLQALASRTIVALENARMVREILEKQRLEEQIQVARTIQRELLPRNIPAIQGYELCAENIPSQHVGGDYYDVVPLEGNRALVAIADVSGKGIPASLLMANIQAGLRTLAPIDITLQEATARLNKLIFENTGADKFITFFWGILDYTAHTFTYVNAGHNPPLLIHNDGSYEELDQGGVLLGALGSAPPYDTGAVGIRAGDMLVMYTDGFSEAMSAEHEEFSEERVRSILTRRPYRSASECFDHIRRELLAFTEGAEQSDDITLITLYRK